MKPLYSKNLMVLVQPSACWRKMCVIINNCRLYLNELDTSTEAMPPVGITFVTDTSIRRGFPRAGNYLDAIDIPASGKEAVVFFTDGGVFQFHGSNEDDLRELFDVGMDVMRTCFSDAERLFKREAKDIIMSLPEIESNNFTELKSLYKVSNLWLYMNVTHHNASMSGE